MPNYYEAYDQRYQQVHARGLEWFSGAVTPIVAQTLEKPAHSLCWLKRPFPHRIRLNYWMIGLYSAIFPQADAPICWLQFILLNTYLLNPNKHLECPKPKRLEAFHFNETHINSNEKRSSQPEAAPYIIRMKERSSEHNRQG